MGDSHRGDGSLLQGHQTGDRPGKTCPEELRQGPFTCMVGDNPYLNQTMQTVVVTGANRGIGLELARQYAADGWRVIATARKPEEAAALQEWARQGPGHRHLLPLEVTDEGQLGAAVEAAGRLSPALELLINNAGVADFSGLEQVTAEAMMRVYRTNCVAPLLVTRAFLPLLLSADRPLVVNISSGLGSISRRSAGSGWGDYAYSASKAALNMVTRQLAIDLRDKGVAVVSQCPGWVRTDMGGAEADLLPTESVRLMRSLFRDYTLTHSGRYFGHHGDEYPW